MKEPHGRRGQRGFTLIELLAAMVILAVLMTFAAPPLLNILRHGKLRGIANETVVLMRLARLQAIKHSCPTIVRVVPAAGEEPARVEGIVDCAAPFGVQDADRSPLGSFPLPAQVRLLAPPDLTDEDSVTGFSPDPSDPAAPSVAIFDGDGSVRATGGFHFGDAAGNFLEVWVAPAATARIEVHKCVLCTNANNRADWYANGDGGEGWQWK
ncbi:MAG TPA: prepilin-type N-terminal cleavage/methylation domain-containing protein [Thermoanaerobaculia bacterium]|jgi:prepilin-type N-terminal cleavage/methylation domain-containing protein